MKKYFTLLAFLLCTFFSTQSLVYKKRFGGLGYDVVSKTVKTADGNFIFAGHSTSSDGDLIGNNGGYDLFITKMNVNGDYLWKKVLGGSLDDIELSLINADDDGMVLLSKSKSSDNIFTENKGNYDFWITKLDFNGNVVWNRTLGGSGEEISGDIIKMDDGYIAALKTKSNDFDFAHSDVISTDVWFAKISFSGEVIWKKRMVGSKEENLPKVFKSDDNTFFALINSNSTDSDFVKNISPDATKGFVFNIDSEGNEIMNYMVESTDISFPTSIFDAQLVDGNIIIAGEEKYLHGLPLYRLYNFFADFIKISKNGDLLWKKTYPDLDNSVGYYNRAYRLETTSDGNFIFFGENQSSAIEPCWAVRIDPDGNRLSYTDLGNNIKIKSVTKNNQGFFVLLTSFYRYAPAGYGRYDAYQYVLNPLGIQKSKILVEGGLTGVAQYAYSIFTDDNTVLSLWSGGQPLLINNKDVDVIITKYDISNLLSTYFMHGNEFKLQVFPNPTSGIIRWSEIANKVSLFDAAGRRLMSAEKVQELNISKFQNGIYFLETEYNGKTSTFKIVKK